MAKQAVMVRSGGGEKLVALGAEVRFLCEAEKTESKWSLMEVTVPKDAGPPLHHHPWDEAYYVIEGDVRFVLGSDVHLVHAGDFLYAPGGAPHAFHGVSEKPARVLIFDAPATAGQFFKDVNREVRSYPADLVKVPEIGARHGLQFVS